MTINPIDHLHFSIEANPKYASTWAIRRIKFQLLSNYNINHFVAFLILGAIKLFSGSETSNYKSLSSTTNSSAFFQSNIRYILFIYLLDVYQLVEIFWSLQYRFILNSRHFAR